MNRKELVETTGMLDKKGKKLLEAKGKDYSNEDALSNFKIQARFSSDTTKKNITPLDICEIHFGKHLIALARYTREQKLDNDTLLSRIVDIRNYLAIYYAIATEK